VMMALLGWLSLFALLLVPAHGISLLLTRRSRHGSGTGRRWLAAIGAVSVLVAPLLAAGAAQAGSLSWVPRPSMATVSRLLADFSGTRLLFPVVLVLSCLCLFMELVMRRLDGWSTAALALPWLVLPPAVLLAVSVAHPVYVERYVVFCMPAVALLAAAGLGWLAKLATPAGAPVRRRLAGALPSCLIVAAAAALLAGPQASVRLSSHRPDDLKAVAAVVAAHELPGDAVVYLPWNAHIVGLTYPAQFHRLRNIGQAASPLTSDTLTGRPVQVDVLAARLRTVQRAWIVRWTAGSSLRTKRALAELRAELRLIRSWRIGSVLLGLYAVRAR